MGRVKYPYAHRTCDAYENFPLCTCQPPPTKLSRARFTNLPPAHSHLARPQSSPLFCRAAYNECGCNAPRISLPRRRRRKSAQRHAAKARAALAARERRRLLKLQRQASGQGGGIVQGSIKGPQAMIRLEGEGMEALRAAEPTGEGTAAAAAAAAAAAVTMATAARAATAATASADGDVDGDVLWVQCERCEKWRRLTGASADSLPDAWFCEMNADAARADCAVPEVPNSAHSKCASAQVEHTHSRKLARSCLPAGRCPQGLDGGNED
eukprot:2610936-Pleurochrysis_carterae.AAC.2